MRRIDLIIIHCSATRSNRSFTFDDLDACHRARGWNGCGYHYYITRDGQLHFGRPEEVPGAHARHYNKHSIGICYEGGKDPSGRNADTRTPEQKLALRTLLIGLKMDYPQAKIIGHRDLPNVSKDCPCFDASTEYAGL
jgi:N-acetyl-anhydromuramyl-L-alanine amidase AmpD